MISDSFTGKSKVSTERERAKPVFLRPNMEYVVIYRAVVHYRDVVLYWDQHIYFWGLVLAWQCRMSFCRNIEN